MKTDAIAGIILITILCVFPIILWLISMDKKQWKSFKDGGFHISIIYPLGLAFIIILGLLSYIF